MIARTSAGVMPLRATTRRHLRVLRAVDDEYPVDRRRKLAAFEQQRHDGDAVGSAPGCDLALAPRAAISGCSAASRRARARGVGEDAAAQSRAVDFAVRRQRDIGELRANRRIARLPRRRQPMRQQIGIDDLDAERGERVRHRGLAAADAPGQADDEWHRFAA